MLLFHQVFLFDREKQTFNNSVPQRFVVLPLYMWKKEQQQILYELSIYFSTRMIRRDQIVLAIACHKFGISFFLRCQYISICLLARYLCYIYWWFQSSFCCADMYLCLYLMPLQPIQLKLKTFEWLGKKSFFLPLKLVPVYQRWV